MIICDEDRIDANELLSLIDDLLAIPDDVEEV